MLVQALALLLALQSVPVYRGQGIYYFEGKVRCPLAGVGARGANHSNRLVLEDDHSTVTVNRDAHRIIFTNTHDYARKTPVGELLFLGTGTTATGERAPLGIHLHLEKRRARFTAAVHVHPTVREKLVAADFEPFEVAAANGRTVETVLAPDSALRAARDPALAARLAKILIEIKDNLEGVRQDAGQPAFRLADISVGLGEGALSKLVLRVQLVSLDGANLGLILRRSVPEMFHSGSWELRLTSLSSLLPREEMQRDLYLLGIDGLPILRGVMKNGLRKGETLSFRFQDGKGTVSIGRESQEIPNAVDVSRAYLEFHFLGAILARQITHPVSGARQ